jgi:hypothetical protein
MSPAEANDLLYQDSTPSASVMSSGFFTHSHPREQEHPVTSSATGERRALPRRTPRKSLIVVLADDHIVNPDTLSARLLSNAEDDETDLIVACAGLPTNLGLLQRTFRDLQVLLAPAGTSNEDLRQLAITRAPGDIVTLMSGSPAERADG